MGRINDGGPAFPRPVSEDRASGDQPDGNNTIREQDGMNLRDYFAGQIAPALVIAGVSGSPESQLSLLKQLGETAYAYADKMLAARGK